MENSGARPDDAFIVRYGRYPCIDIFLIAMLGIIIQEYGMVVIMGAASVDDISQSTAI